MKSFLRFAGVFAIAFSCAAFPAVAETPATSASAPVADQRSAKKVVHDFFGRLKAGKVDEAFDELLKGTKIAETASDVAMLKTKTREALELGGSLDGAELIDEKTAGTRLMSLTYLSLGESYPLRWRFYFYRTQDYWKLIDIRISDRLAEMLGESGAASETAP